jgi:hypothetical protein
MLKHIAAVTLSLGLAAAAIADERPYKDGPVTEVSYIRVKDGKQMDYIGHLASIYRKEMEAYKKAGLILEYRIYSTRPHTPTDPNLILTVTYPNYAALDRTADFDAIDTKLAGSLKAMDTAYGERGSIREVLGTDVIQEMILK